MSLHDKPLRGGGGRPKTPPSPTNTPDSLRSEDTVEVILGLAEGPIQGLKDGAKSFYVGDTLLERNDGERNFEEFELKVYNGEAMPDPLVFKLGGASNNTQVGVALAYGTPVTRQTQTGNVDAIDVRLIVSQLYKSVESGKNPGIFDNTFQFRIRFKPLSSPNWSDWTVSSMYETVTNKPTTPWSHLSYMNEMGVWVDPMDPSKSWDTGKYEFYRTWFLGEHNPTSSPTFGELSITGKTTSAYVKEYRIPVERIPEPYQIQVQRLSADSSLGGDPRYIAEVTWESFQEIDLKPKEYPNTAIVQVVGKATDQFTSIPQFSGVYKGLIVRVPNNYDPETHTYTGIWDGTWKNAWTNNPVWLLYEAIHNDRWGWATYTNVQWSKYEAYELAKICDYILPNGKPRYTFNAYLTEPMDGREFCRYLAGSFNSVIVDDNNGNVRVLMDKDDPAVAIVGPESIVGHFEYTFTDVNTRYNDVTVVFRNPEIRYNEDRRRLSNDAHIAQHGRIPFDFIAVGCTDENEALRKASRRLVSATTETEMVTFKTNRRAAGWAPYEVILITDPYKGYGLSGRFKSWTGTTAQLRDPIYLEVGVHYQVDIQTPTGVISRDVVNTERGWVSQLIFNTALPSNIYQKEQFSLKDAGEYGMPKPYRITNLVRDAEDEWTVSCIELNRLKFAAEDNAQLVGEPEYSFLNKGTPDAPTNVKARNISHAAPDGTMIYKVRVDFTPPSDPYVNEYLVRYRMEGEKEYEVVETDGTGFEIILPYEGVWEFQARSRNIWEQVSSWVDSVPKLNNISKHTAISGGSVVSATGGLNQITVKVLYPTQTDIRYAHIYASTTSASGDAVYVGKTDSDTFVHTNLVGVQSRYYFVKFEDNLGNVGGFASTTGVAGTTTQAGSGDIADGAITPQKFVPGVSPVESVSSLPMTDNFEGRVVFNLEDGRLYRWNGTGWDSMTPEPSESSGVEVVDTLPAAGNFEGRIVYLKSDNKIYRFTEDGWVASTHAGDIVGQIVAAQIENGALIASKFPANVRPVEIVDTLPTSGNTVGRQVYLTTDGKLYRWNGTAWTNGFDAADLSGSMDPGVIPNLAITAEKLADLAISSSKLANGAVIDSKISSGINASKISGSLINATISAAALSGSINSTQIGDDSVITSKIAANAIVGSHISANTISASKLVLSDQSNIFPDPDLEDPNIWWGDGVDEGKLLRSLTSVNQGSKYLIGLNADVVARGITCGPIQCAANTPYYFSIAVAFQGTAEPNGGQVVIDWIAFDGAGTASVISTSDLTGLHLTAIPTRYSQTLTSPATAKAFRVRVIRYGGGTARFNIYGPIIRRATSAELIVDGAITTDKLAANSVNAGKIAANSINSTHIQSGAITTSKLLVTPFNLNPDYPFAEGIAGFANDEGAWKIEGSWAGNVSDSLGVPRTVILKSSTDPVPAGQQRVLSAPVKSVNIEGGTSYRLRVPHWNASNRTAKFGIHFYRRGTDGDHYKSSEWIDFPSGGGKNIQERLVTAPADANCYHVQYVVNSGPNAMTGSVLFGGYTLIPAITAEAVVNGAITADKLSANSVTAGKIAANAVTAGTIQAGAIGADAIQANSILAKHLVLSSTDNIIPDGNFNDRSFWNAFGGSTEYHLIDLDGGWTNGTRGLLFAGGQSFDQFTDWIPVEQETQYEVEFRAWGNRPLSGGWFMPLIEVPGFMWCNMKLSAAAGVQTAASPSMSPPAADRYDYPFDTFNNSRFTLSIPGGYFIKGVRFRFMGNLPAGGDVIFTVRIRQKAGANLIVDGSITGDKLVANTITGSKIAANTITGSNIAASTITAGNISVANLAAINSNLGAITGGSLNIASKFIVDPSGNVTIRNATTGARLVLTNQLLQVYDASNVLRVSLGIW